MVIVGVKDLYSMVVVRDDKSNIWNVNTDISYHEEKNIDS